MKTLIVVPCYNERKRLHESDLLKEVDHLDEVGFIMVNDGSTDGTGEALAKLEKSQPKRFQIVTLDQNQGKAQAVRMGMLEAIKQDGVEFAGYWDADWSTPADEILRFVDEMVRHPKMKLLMGSRVKLLGRRIERSRARHYAGRVFATFASMTLNMPVYDTQCGAKLFRCDEQLGNIFDKPFYDKWLFDVEILFRLRNQLDKTTPIEEVVHELPLEQWIAAEGSHVRVSDFVKSIYKLWRIKKMYTKQT